MKKILFLFICLGLFHLGFAQKDSLRQKTDFRPFATRIGLDLTHVMAFPFSKNKATHFGNTQKFGVEADISFFQNMLSACFDVGYAAVSRVINDRAKGFNYVNEGIFWRAGLDYNILHKTLKEDAILLGFRYGQTFFRDSLNYNDFSPIWGFVGTTELPGYGRQTPMENGKATWVELNAGLRSAIWRNWQLGFTFRYKILLELSEKQFLESNDLPGYGTTETRSKPAISYHVYYRIPLQKAAKLPPLPKKVKQEKP